MINEKLCLIPFVSISTHPGGFVSRCMMSSLPMGLINDPNVWDNNKFIELRKDMVENRWNLPGCKTCYERETQGLISQRINWKTNERWWNGDIWDSKDFSKSIINNKIYHLFLNTSNLCNFKCRMCSSLYSNSWINDDRLLVENGFNRKLHKSYTKNKNKIKEFITNLLPRLSELRMITVTGGEPFINDDFLEVSEILDQAGILKNLHLSITTNASLLTEQHLIKLKNAKKVNINISIDGTDKLFEYMRSDSRYSWEYILDIIKMVCDFRNENKNFILSLNASYQIYNMLNVKDFYDWAESIIQRPNEWIEYRLLTHPEYLHASIAPEDIKIKSEKQCDYVESKYDERNKFFLNNMRKNLKMPRIESQWNDFQKFTRILDDKRKQDIKIVCPELYEYFTI
jgi:MoaA/NifB/PqqE/SkfB family radical SAM enzyme